MNSNQYIGDLILSGTMSLLGGSVLSKFLWPDEVRAQPGHRGIITT